MDVSKQMSEGRIGRPKAGSKTLAGFTRGDTARQPNEQLFGLEKGVSSAYLGAMTVHFPFQNTYAALPANFFARVMPTPVASPRLIKLNRPLAVHLGLDPDMLETPEGAEI